MFEAIELVAVFTLETIQLLILLSVFFLVLFQKKQHLDFVFISIHWLFHRGNSKYKRAAYATAKKKHQA